MIAELTADWLNKAESNIYCFVPLCEEGTVTMMVISAGLTDNWANKAVPDIYNFEPWLYGGNKNGNVCKPHR